MTHTYTGQVVIETDRESSLCVTTPLDPLHTIDQGTDWQYSHTIMRRTQSPVTHTYICQVVIDTDIDLSLCVTIPSSPLHTIGDRLAVFPCDDEEEPSIVSRILYRKRSSDSIPTSL